MVNTPISCMYCVPRVSRAATHGRGNCNRHQKVSMSAIGRSPSSIAEAFFSSSMSSATSDTMGQGNSNGNSDQGPDAVVSFLSDDIVAAAFEHARNLR